VSGADRRKEHRCWSKIIMNETAFGVSLRPVAVLKKYGGILSVRTTAYICIVLVAALASYWHWIRTRSIFACTADGYTADQYVANCNATGYGDYEHGAFWYGLEPSALNFAKEADVLFLGNSRLQFAFSTSATANWFSAAFSRYYLLGFSYYENMTFLKPLLSKLNPRAKVYVISLDDFFEQTESPPVKTIFHDPSARSTYETKRLWQSPHEWVCRMVPAICRREHTIFRSRETGAYSRSGHFSVENVTPVSYDRGVSEDVVKRNTAAAIDFLSRLPVQKDCVILTMTPTTGTKVENYNAIAAALGKVLVMPQIPGLQTFDGSHLDPPSAERWSQAFFQAAGPEIRSCLKKQGARQP
jgi:hypothetical protein